MAIYSVPTASAQALVAGSGLEILQYRPGRGLCTLVFVDYLDGDLGPTTSSGSAFSSATTIGAAERCCRTCVSSVRVAQVR